MRKFKFLITIMLLVLVSGSCKKRFLEVTNNSNLNRQSYVKDLNSIQELMNGIHLTLSTIYEEGPNAAYPGLISDELKVSSLTASLALHNNWSQVADSRASISNETCMDVTWMNLYKIIRSCNFVIEDVDKYSAENPEKAKSIKGQAYAIRAMLYLRLVNIFAQHYTFTAGGLHPGVPYITTSDISKPYTRQSVAEVYRNMITDLESAISLMPGNLTDTRYMNGPAAKALLCRIYLYQGDYQKAKDLAVELASQHPLMSVSAGYPVDVFKFKAPAQTEVLFQVTPANEYSRSGEAYSLFLGIYLLIDYFRPTADIAGVLIENTNDIRSTWVSSSGSNWLINKFPPGVAGGLAYDPSTDYYVPVVRSSEIFLTAAEASAKTKDETSARLYLNEVRKRADPSAIDVTATGQTLIDLIYKERRKELCFEGFRMWDLQRWKQGVHRTDVFTGYQIDLPYPSDKAIAPIPAQDVKLMGLQQNIGY